MENFSYVLNAWFLRKTSIYCVSLNFNVKYWQKNEYIWNNVFKNGLSKNLGRQRSEHTEDSDNFKFFKGCPPQILLGPFLNTLTIYTLRQITRTAQKTWNKPGNSFKKSYFLHWWKPWLIKKIFSKITQTALLVETVKQFQDLLIFWNHFFVINFWEQNEGEGWGSHLMFNPP